MRLRSLRTLLSTSAILLPLTAAFLGAQQSSAAQLDATVARVMAEQHVVGASALVAKDGRVLLHKGYGLADLGLLCVFQCLD
jgi:CubicO group peptidase (beta-lactamase class C family)